MLAGRCVILAAEMAGGTKKTNTKIFSETFLCSRKARLRSFGSYALGSSFMFSAVIASVGFGGGVVAIVQPIQAPIARIAMNAAETSTSALACRDCVKTNFNFRKLLSLRRSGRI